MDADKIKNKGISNSNGKRVILLISYFIGVYRRSSAARFFDFVTLSKGSLI